MNAEFVVNKHQYKSCYTYSSYKRVEVIVVIDLSTDLDIQVQDFHLFDNPLSCFGRRLATHVACPCSTTTIASHSNVWTTFS